MRDRELMRDRDCLVVMARRPEAGTTKTRLAQCIGDSAAARLYEAFLLDTLAVCGDGDAAVMISYAPATADAAAYMGRIAPDAMLAPQPDVDFGARLAAAMQAAFDRGYARVAVIGSDIPHMSGAWIEDAFAGLEQHDVAIGPTHDGGYYLLALGMPQPGLFEGIDWSTGLELGQTLERAAGFGLDVGFVETTFDVDDVGDLVSLREHIAANGTVGCPRTAAVLATIDVSAGAAPAMRGQ
jgi:hypothetical protein